MEVDKTKLTELLVAMCSRAMVIGDNLICSDIYNKQCQITQKLNGEKPLKFRQK